jgi:hypothetical protein
MAAAPGDTQLSVPPTVMDAMPGLLLLQEPPKVASLSMGQAPPRQALAAVLAMGFGRGFTMAVAVDAQPVPSVYEIRLVPAVIPVSRPVVDTMEAAPVLLLQVPPPVPDSVADWFTQTLSVPLMAPGMGFTLRDAVL